MKLEHSGERIIEAAFRFKVQDLETLSNAVTQDEEDARMNSNNVPDARGHQ
jgi:hypothetical protein